jgi:FtsP/CotA-like multicopper oxidase with cupredoxin domain
MSKKALRRIGLGSLILAGVLAFSVSSTSAIPTPPAIGVVCTNGPTFSLTTATGYIYTPDGNSVYMWSYAPTGGSFQSPGPVLCVNQGDPVTVDLTNTLPEPVSIVFPGQTDVSATMMSGAGVTGTFTLEANTGETVRYTFLAGEPGTYLYESGSNPHKQVHMGLYGALIVRPDGDFGFGPDYAYNHTSAQFDTTREYLILLHEIDPDLHSAVEEGFAYDVTKFRPRYFTINGRAFPDTVADNNAPWLPSQPYGALVEVRAATGGSQPALIRYANASMANHPFHPHGNHLKVIARDGRLLRGPIDEDTSFENFTRTIGSGQTYDLLFKWTEVDAWISPGGTPVPVTIPGLQNLVFKDGATFYSGDPELGEQDELPVDVVTYNECGEFYFPWHSHALFEFTNFNEGFGGLATILRVDPPTGCP